MKNRLSPLTLSLVGAMVLMIIVAAIARSATADRGQIAALTGAGQQAIAVPYANSVADALPAFSLAPTPAPTRSPGAGAFDAQQWLDMQWLNIAYDGSGGKWIYANAWLFCGFIDPVALTYDAAGNWPTETSEQRIWRELAIQQDSIISRCNEVTP